MRIRLSHKLLCSMLVSGLVGLTGCTGNAGQPQILSTATLNFANASISLPLDAYSMTSKQEAILEAAQQIVFARCILGSADIPTFVKDYASSLIATDTSVKSQWLYGYWDTKYIASEGLGSGLTPYSLGQGLNADLTQARACVYSDEFMSLNVIDGNTLTSSSDEDSGTTGLLMSIGQSAYAQTLADDRFIKLANKRAACVISLGYTIDHNSSFQGVAQQDGWSPEQTLRAALAEAQCSDQLNLTQQAADINATYQQILIDQHEAELVAVQQTVSERIARAEEILRSVGLM